MSITAVSGASVGIVSDDLMSAIGDDLVEEELLLGDVLDGDGNRLRGFRTFIGRHRVLIRGDSSSSYRACGRCGEVIYAPLGDWYLIGEPSGAQLFEDQFSQLVVPESIADRVKERGPWKKMGIRELVIRAEPLDGFELP